MPQNSLKHILFGMDSELSTVVMTLIISALRGLIDGEGLKACVLDSVLCSVFTLLIYHTEYFTNYANHHPDASIGLCIVVGSLGSKYFVQLVKRIFEMVLPDKISKSK